jgi:hypothetical protein
MYRFSVASACQLFVFLAFTATPLLAQSSENKSSNDTLHTIVPRQAALASTPANSPNTQDEGEAGASVVAIPVDLPNKPEPNVSNPNSSPGSSNSDFRSRDSPPMGYGAYRTSNRPFWVLTGSVYGSNIAAIELLQGCLANNRCRTLPPAIRNRPAMYATGLGVASGVSYLGYYLKKKEVRWWFVPAVLATTFDVVFVVGAAKRQ